MSAALLIVLIGVGVMLALPPILASRAQTRATQNLSDVGHLTVATITSVQSSDDTTVKFEFVLPDGQSIQKGTTYLPSHLKIVAGDRLTVRYNPKLPAICRLEPHTEAPAQTHGVGSAT